MWTHLLIIVVLLMTLLHAHANLNLGRMIAGRQGVDSADLGYWNLVAGSGVSPSGFSPNKAAWKQGFKPQWMSWTVPHAPTPIHVYTRQDVFKGVDPRTRYQSLSGLTNPATPHPAHMPNFMDHAKKMDAQHMTPAKKMETLMMNNDQAQRKLRSKLVGDH